MNRGHLRFARPPQRRVEATARDLLQSRGSVPRDRRSRYPGVRGGLLPRSPDLGRWPAPAGPLSPV